MNVVFAQSHIIRMRKENEFSAKIFQKGNRLPERTLTMSERELLDRQAVQGFLGDELGSLRRFALSITGSMDDADDLVQATVERVLTKGLPVVAPKPWLIKVCKNIWIDELRKRTVRNHEEFEDGKEELPDADTNPLETEFVSQRKFEAIGAAIDQLSDDHRLALSMVVVEGMSYAEVAEALDTPIGTVMSRVARARSMLRKHLTGADDGQ